MQQASFDKGSFASLLGVRIADGGRAIQVLSVGDSLAVLCDGDRIKATFPLSSAAEFTRSPQLICTNPTHNAFLDKMDLSLRPRRRLDLSAGSSSRRCCA